MAKVLLVEDDNNLREIYQARLTAEGYDIVTAQNGEEALVVAKQNKPDLIISDVMMPRISGFEMLDILRNTDELKHTRVIMLTALGQADDQKRANSLGADRYLVKSQVTLEDIVNAAKELLSGDGLTTPAVAREPAAPVPMAPSVPSPVASTPIAPTVTTAPVQVAPEPVTAGAPAPAPTPMSMTPPAPQPVAPAPMPTPIAAPVVTPVEPPAAPLMPSTTSEPPQVTSAAEPPIEGTPSGEGPVTPAVPPDPDKVDSVAQGLEAEEAALEAQIASYSKSTPSVDGAANNNDQAIADALKQLDNSNATSMPEPPQAAVAATAPVPAPIPDPSAGPTPGNVDDNVTVAGKKIIQPISDPTAKPDLNALLAKEEAKAGPAAGTPAPAPAPSPTPAAPTPGGQGFDPNTSL